MMRAVKRPGDIFDTSTNPRTKRGERSRRSVLYFWSLGRWFEPMPSGAFFVINFTSFYPARFSLSSVHKGGIKQQLFLKTKHARQT